MKTYRKENLQKINASQKKYREENHEKILLSYKRYRIKNRDIINKKSRARRSANPEKAREASRKCSKKNRKRINAYSRLKYKNDAQYRISTNLKRRIRTAIERILNNKTIETNWLFGCDILKFKLHIESLFQDGMAWDNHGNKGWHIDHLIPVKMFDVTIDSERKKCFHYSNLQPLWAEDNRKKGVKIGINT
jgi:hypothetical protein